MTLGDDERGRVPFALIGVLLLVGSATLSAGLGPREPRPADPARERAVEEATSAARTAFRAAAREAGRRAAAAPVVDRANTTAAGVLRRERVFRDTLRIRLYLAAARRFERIRGRAGPVTATVRLARPRNTTALDRAMRRADVERAGRNGTALRAGVRNATVVVRRAGRVVERRQFSPSVVVASPVLFVHDRVSHFQETLRAPTTAPGLARRLTARLYALAWGRGFAQFGGAPIENVVASRHVAHATNAALITEQRRSFGRSDRASRRAYRAMARQVVGRDVLRGAGLRPRTADALASATDATLSDRREWTPTTWGDDAPAHDESVSVSADIPATAAFVPFVHEELAGVLDRVYGARVRNTATASVIDTERRGRIEPSAAGEWELADRDVENTTRVSNDTVTAPEAPRGWHVLNSYGRRVVRTRTVVRQWKSEDSNDTDTTRRTVETTYAVAVAVVGRHAPSGHVPRRGIDPIHERGGPLDGPNLAGIEERAIVELVHGRGGPDELARQAARDELETGAIRIEADRPERLREWVVRDLAGLRERLASESIRVDRGALGTFDARPHRRLATALDAERGSLIDEPSGRYDGAASKARIAARAAYLDRVFTRLEQRAGQRRSARERVDGLLAEYGSSTDSLGAARRAARKSSMGRRRTFDDLSGSLDLSIDAAPPYLAATRLDTERVDAAVDGPYYGVDVRNVNLFTVPYGDAADSVVGAASGGNRGRVRLRVAAGTLRGANRLAAVDGVHNATLDDRRRALRADVRSGLDHVRELYLERLEDAEIGRSAAAREALVRAALSRWETPAARAIAATNGSAAQALVDAADGRYPNRLGSPSLRGRLRASLADAGRGVTINETRTRRAVAFLRDGLEASARDLATERLDRYLRHRVGAIPAGLPLAPVPGYWYATTNVWVVHVRGGYARLTVRADRGPPGASLAYTRDGSSVRLDVDADGEQELLGRAPRVTFDARTAVAVVVPPGARGVGDVDGNADERSPGWG